MGVTAYKDPLGTVAPRIRVQVKHREQKVTIKEVRELEAVMRKQAACHGDGVSLSTTSMVRSSCRWVVREYSRSNQRISPLPSST